MGAVPNTKAPEPVSSVTALARLAELGVARKVATPEPRPDTPVEMGSPVAFVSVPELGVPKAGVTRVGEVALTNPPVPVELAPPKVSTIAETVVSSKTVLAAEVKEVIEKASEPVE